MKDKKRAYESQIRKIRDHINRIEKQCVLIKDRGSWNKLCASLDVLEDSQHAIDYYVISEYPSDFRGKYLFTYGLLQAIYLQQDALKHLNESLGLGLIKYHIDYPELNDIREIRNDVTGHPTERHKTKFIYLAQISMQKDSFSYMVFEVEKETTHHPVDVLKTIETQMKLVQDILQEIIIVLDNEFVDYINKFRDVKLVNFFDTDYYCDGSYNIAIMKEIVKNCKGELESRYGTWSNVEYFEYLVVDIDLIFSLLDKNPNISNGKDLFITRCFEEQLGDLFREIKECCIEIDEYFYNYGDPGFDQGDCEDEVYDYTHDDITGIINIRPENTQFDNIFSMLGYAREKTLTDSLLKTLGFDMLKRIVDKCKKVLNEKYGSWERVLVYCEQIKDIDNLTAIIERKEYQYSSNDRNNIEKILIKNLFKKLENLKKDYEHNEQ